jgi:hypothetical protein
MHQWVSVNLCSVDFLLVIVNKLFFEIKWLASKFLFINEIVKY